MSKPIIYVAALTLIFQLLWPGEAWAPPITAKPAGLHPTGVGHPSLSPKHQETIKNKLRGLKNKQPITDSFLKRRVNPIKTRDEQARDRLSVAWSSALAMTSYEAEFAVHLYDIGFDEQSARDYATADCIICGNHHLLFSLWKEEHRLNPSARDTVESILALNEKAKQVREQNRIDEEKHTFEYKAEPFERTYEKAKTLPPEIVNALKSAKLGRKIVLSPSMPKVLLRATDNPALDRAIIEHVWYANDMALHVKVSPERLHLIDLFAGSDGGDLTGDRLESDVQGFLSDIRKKRDQHLTADQVEAFQTVRKVLVGEYAFDQALLVERLKALQGHMIFVLGHIPEAPSEKGAFEHKKKDGTMTHTPIADLAAALRKAGVSFAPVGCMSEKHHSIGVDSTFRNVGVLKRMISVLTPSVEPRSSTQWFSDFLPEDAMLIIDPLS